MKQIVLTGIRKVCEMEYVDTPESFVNGPASLEILSELMQDRTKHWLIFNNGLFQLPCDDETFKKVEAFFKPTVRTEESRPKKLAILPTLPPEVPEGAQVFSAEEPPVEEEDEDVTDEEDWSGAADNTADGVSQV